ncbi:MAG: Hsp33 family molecular chaperone HslO [Lachnospiraceae bacterium]|nr:Hsp33 family molecular chaperone HslO [Lachnospiraceae bacterium]
MSDYIVRGTAANNQIRVFAATTRDLVEHARAAHNTSPVSTAALGRLLTGGVMMGSMMKGDKDMLTLQIQCSGPITGLTVTADSKGNVKGYAYNPNVMLPPSEAGKLDVGKALDLGVLSVIKDMGLKEPYMGQTQLVSGEIAEDLTYYFATSEQVPSAVALGVLMEKDNTVKRAGGFIIQLMPFAEDGLAEKLEEKLKNVTSITSLLEKGMSPEDIVEELLGEFGVEFMDTLPAQFYCNCCKERVSKALVSVGAKELNEMIQEGKPVELNCHFCNTNYTFSVEELKEILRRSKR